MNTPKTTQAFSLIEVVVAVGIFAIAIVSIIGLLVPISKSVVDIREGDYAARLVTLAQAQIQNVGFNELAGTTGYIDQSKINPDLKGGLYASKDGSKFGFGENTTLWGTTSPNAEKFFKIELSRNESLSGTDGTKDAEAGFLAFNMKVTWTVYSQDGKEVGKPQLETMIIPCAITR